ncbi:MAG TPA: AraC family transcriptional regulator [Gemmatimonadales bacterium]|nr:AraC family transcriptional regulator [Gemmatimonadales bacterium]
MADLHARLLHGGPLVRIVDYHCRASHSGPGAEEVSTEDTVVFTRRGVFVKHVGGRRIVLDANHVHFYRAGEPYRVSHPVPGGDDCTSFRFAPDLLREALTRHEPEAQDRAASLSGLTHAPVSPDVVLLQQRLRQRLRHAAAGPLEAEEVAIGVLRRVVHHVARIRDLPRSRTDMESRAVASRRREWVEAARLLLAAGPERNASLQTIARDVACSPFHLARIFRDATGLPLHRYQLRLRLALALERLAEGEANLSALAYDLGFSSHGHFTTTFRAFFGVSPSGFRRTATVGRVRELSKNLEAPAPPAR